MKLIGCNCKKLDASNPDGTLVNDEDGGAEGIQTPDPLIANQMLYQLSYSPME